MADAVRRKDLIVLESIEQRDAYYPDQTRLPSAPWEAWLAIPMGFGNHAVGAIGLGFSQPRKFNEQELLFIRTLAVLCGHALDRAHLCDAERIARERAERAEQDLKRRVKERTRYLQETLGKLQDLTSGLLTAQDNERKWVSGELHDDFNQKLAAVELELARLELRFSDVAPNLSSSFDPVKSLVRQISDDIRRVAYKIHPASLDHLGLLIVLKSYCADFGRREGIDIKFSHRAIPVSLPPDVMLCMYRVTQECLSNVAKHSSAKNATVSIACNNRDLHLSVRDSGAGLNLKELQDSRGLGVLYMKERVRGAKGTFSIRSKQGKGVRVDVHITLPLRARSATR
jgi:signal transduction histidine kinase